MTWTAYRRAHGAILFDLRDLLYHSFIPISFSHIVVCMNMHNMDKRTLDFETDKVTMWTGIEIWWKLQGLEEAIDLFTGDMTRWTLRDVEVSNGSLFVSY